jgi:hypothetical protein
LTFGTAQGPQAGVVTVGFIGGEPAKHRPGVAGPGKHAGGQFGFCRELHLLADPGLTTPIAVSGPGHRQIQFTVDQRPTFARRVGQKHAELAILDSPGRAGVLALHASRLGALCRPPGYAKCGVKVLVNGG